MHDQEDTATWPPAPSTWPDLPSAPAGRVAGERTHPRRVTPRRVGRGFMGIAGSKQCTGNGR
jgi:hypothetical protein